MKSVIKSQINTVFIHVSDLRESVNWYSQLLGHDVDLSKVSDPVYNFQLNHHTGLTLDSGPNGETKDIKASQYPLFNFHTDDIQKSYEDLQKQGYQIETDIIEFDDLAYFNVSDPDQNIIMICNA
ncbi:VOC family protein [Aquisalibacillus elongatus]|uniref:Glyoxalase/bleomycin resistance protein/dioxygenase superfamily protein n=1 Tax=Aquisalibacillus elongatus TaxID=485577 RepID=A0A3N5BZN5_9BACI|nr:VOC family protein [Aquisalibacillus elongatus]RPF55288.1 glyoxalase/bleomycin resistance protein/dioxygenase superfamily protein [Aquisalibacillus elongatus]